MFLFKSGRKLTNAYVTLALPTCFSLLMLFSLSLHAANLEVIKYSPAPNYPLSKDEMDIKQLTDGVLSTKAALWGDKKAVTWASDKSITIDLIASGNYKDTRAIGLHIGCGMPNGVFFPEYIEIYDTGNNKKTLVAKKEFPQECQRKSYWKKIPVTLLSKNIQLVIKPGNKIVSIDEIKLFNELPEEKRLPGSITMTHMWPEPKYPLTRDETDLEQLSDGVLVNDPIWGKKEAVGWQRAPVIRLKFEVNYVHSAPYTGSIGIRVPCGNKSDVQFPEYIDLYEDSGNSNKLLASKKFSKECEDGAYFEKLPFYSSVNKYLMIIKPRKRLFITDEIRYFDEKSEVVNVSSESKKIKFVSDKPEVTHIKHPYSNLLKTSQVQESLTLTGLKDEWESAVFLIENPTQKSLKFNIRWDNLGRLTQAYELKPVKTATEKLVKDALIKLDGKQVTIPSGETKYIWIKTRLTQEKLTSKPQITFSSHKKNYTKSFPVKFKIVDCKKEVKLPHVITWGYLDYGPVCTNHKQQCVDDGKEHYTNVYVVPPGKIPTLMDASNQKRNKAFSDYIKNIPNNNKLLLYMDIRGGNYQNFRLEINNHSSSTITTIQKWLSTVNAHLERNGFSKKNWAVYAIDEPKTKEAEVLVNFFKILDTLDSDVQIYENPAGFDINKIPENILTQFFSYVDIMQPLATNFAQFESKYQKFNGSLWVYDIPAEPAKERSPFLWYRGLSIKAWMKGLEGVGFWSYDGTSKSSAWNDSDGYRADYAVVYEGDNGPVSSRRWEAFSDGVEDYKLLTLHDKHTKSNSNLHRIENSMKDQGAFMKIREQMLGELIEHGCDLVK